jgi:hypothetical protein
MGTHDVTARIAPADPASVAVGLHLHEEAPGRATAVATDNGHLLMNYYFSRGGRTIVVQSDEGARRARISHHAPGPPLWLDLDLALVSASTLRFGQR